MRLFEHRLSEETLALIVAAVDAIGGRLALYGPHNWAVEQINQPGRLAFDPTNDSIWLRDQLQRIIHQGM